MATDAELFRLLRAVMRFVDRHAESKDGPGVIQVPLQPREMQQLRSSLEPFREQCKALEALSRKRLAEIVKGAVATDDEAAIRAAIDEPFLDATVSNGER